jgi:hypothetical protein
MQKTKLKKLFFITKVPDDIKQKIMIKMESNFTSCLNPVFYKITFKGASFYLVRTSHGKKSDSYSSVRKKADQKTLKAVTLAHEALKTVPQEVARFLPPDLNATVAKKRKKTLLNNLIQENRNREQLTILSEKFSILEYWSERDGYIFNSHDHYSEVLKRLFKYMKNNWRETAAGKKAWDRERKRQLFENYSISRPSLYDFHFEKSGGVYLQEKTILGIYRAKINNILKVTKKPMTMERHIGVELEASIPRKNLESLTDSLRLSVYRHYLALGTDGSVTSNDKFEGSELRICAPTSKIKEVVSFVSAALIKAQAKVDKSCGMHVHLDARPNTGANAKNMFERLVDQQFALFQVVPSSRRSNRYCKYTKKDDWRGTDRYKAVNPLSFKKYNTIEVRMHSGTVDANKIIPWINLLEAIAYSTADISTSRAPHTMLEKFNLDKSTIDYFNARADLFKNGREVNTSDYEEDYQDFESEEVEEDDSISDLPWDDSDDELEQYAN